MSEEVGIVASDGVKYTTKSAIQFREADYDRKITGNGDSILIYEQKGDYKSVVWENGSDPSKEEIATVRAGCRVVLIGTSNNEAAVTFTRE